MDQSSVKGQTGLSWVPTGVQTPELLMVMLTNIHIL